MRIPPHYQQPTWQRFFAGVAIGAIISWGVFLFIFGVVQEKQSTEIEEQRTKINELIKKGEIYQQEYSKLNKEAQKKLTVQELNIDLTNGDKYHLKEFKVKNIEDKVKNELADIVIAKDIESINSNHLLIERMIENLPIELEDGNKYKLKMTKFMLHTTLSIEIEISFSD
ncbi:mannitol-specific phosphotransferase system IIBC component [Metabacillus crassostreae]|uniref:sporulation membrane protein YtrI n=1 Tax=Metabacillus crassostreae TaxID=929098 RepID=UPI00195C936E|nr:sporulation membrane protein YtrI [Metabacillus crassostreae]MBM7605644.1 mannitol-specific phosphotransferase system IIBC component [Metabacillus crassostreae]